MGGIYPILPNAEEIRPTFRGVQLVFGTVNLSIVCSGKEQNVTIFGGHRRETVNGRSV